MRVDNEYHSNGRIEGWKCVLNFLFLSGKPLLMVQSLKRALKVEPDHPEIHSCLIRLHRFLQKGELLDESVSHPAVASVLKSEAETLFRGHLKAAEPLNQDFLERNARSLPHLLQGGYP